jgi:hypothetical protein
MFKAQCSMPRLNIEHYFLKLVNCCHIIRLARAIKKLNQNFY